MQNFKRGEGLSLRAKAGMLLASVLAAGALAPAPNTQQANNGLTSEKVAQVNARLNESKNDKAAPAQTPAPSGQSLALSAGNDYTTYLRPTYGPCPPHVWGQSPECARMVRNHRMRKLGIGGARI